MIGDSLKGILFLAVIGFALLGVATVLPDSAWEKIPPKLIPVRQYLAEKGVISEKYLKENVPPRMVCSGGVCRLEDEMKTDDAPSKLKSRSEVEKADSLQEPPNSGDAELPAPPPVSSPITSDPITEKTAAGIISDADEFPKTENDLSLPPAKTEIPLFDVASADSEPNTDPVKTASSSDTLPHLQFDKEESETDAGFPVVPSEIRGQDVTGESSPASFAEAAPSPRLSEESFPVNADSDDHLKSVGRFETEESFSATPPRTSDLPMEETRRENGSDPKNVPTQPSLHKMVNDTVALSDGPGASASIFLKLNDILTQYDSQLTPEDRAVLNRALDRLAFNVFYNPKAHILWREYSVGQNETLASVAGRHKITPEFLAVINSIHQKADTPLKPGQRLKIVEGPVTAEVSMSRMELLLKFNGLYAGRFKMGYAQRAGGVRGEFSVVRKIPNPDYHGPIADGSVGQIPGGDPRNPLGPCWIELTGGLGLQGTNHPEYVGQKMASVGGLIFSNKDISHLNILLSDGSTIRITD